MARTLGFSSVINEIDTELVKQLLAFFGLHETDMTIFFRQLATVSSDVEKLDVEHAIEQLSAAFYADELLSEAKEALKAWLANYWQRRQQDPITPRQRTVLMNKVNPKYVLRNYLAQLAIDKSEQGDHSGVNELLEVLRKPYDEQPGKEHLNQKRPDWAKHKVGCSMLSCSS
jgi:uncharacterized protein YdiU (UPF0061 family)